MISILLIIIGFAVLIKGADLLIDGASAIARRINVSDLVIGLTVVAFGTSSPELFVNIVASINGTAGIAIGNIVGSTIANILLVLGVAALLYPLSVTPGTVWKEIPMSLFAAVILGIMASDHILGSGEQAILSRLDAIILLCFFIFFLYYSFSIASRTGEIPEQVPTKQYTLPVACILVLIGLTGLSFGGRWVVTGAVEIARALKVSETFIGLTIIAFGTSLPELATGAVAALKKNPAIAIGSIVGSNIFNIFLVLSTSALIRPIPLQAASHIDIGVMILANILLFVSMFTGERRRIDRWEGGVFVILYCAYIAFLIYNA